MAASNEQIQAYLRQMGVDPGLFRNFGANELSALQRYDAGTGDYANWAYRPVSFDQYMQAVQADPSQAGQYSFGVDGFSTKGDNYGATIDPSTGNFGLRVKVGNKDSVEVPYMKMPDGSWAPDWNASKAASWDTNKGNKDNIKGMATVLGAAAGGYLANSAGLFGGGLEAMGAGAAPGEAAGAFSGSALGGSVAPATAIPGMNAGGGWGLTGGMEALGGGGAIGSTVGSGGLSELMAGGLTGTGGASGGLGAGSASGGLSSLFGGGSGGGMASFLPSSLGEWGSAIGNWLPLLGAVGGAAQGSQDQTITNQTQLPPWLQALGPQLTNASINAANQPFQPYGGQRIEPFNPTQQAAFGMVQNRAMNGSPVERAGQDAVTRAASGNANPMFGLDNPYLNKQIDNTLGDLNRNFERTVLPNIDAMNTRANTGFGTSSAVNGEGGLRSEAYRNLNETAAKTANDMRYKDYYTQAQLGEGMAGRQLQAAGLAPNLGAVDYRNADALLGIGNQQQQLGQQGQDFNYQEFMRQLQYPDQQLQRLGYPFGFNQGQTQTSTTPGVGPWAGGISGLLGGIGMSNMIGRGGTAVSGPATMTPPPRTTLPSNGYGLDGFYPYAWGGA